MAREFKRHHCRPDANRPPYLIAPAVDQRTHSARSNFVRLTVSVVVAFARVLAAPILSRGRRVDRQLESLGFGEMWIRLYAVHGGESIDAGYWLEPRGWT